MSETPDFSSWCARMMADILHENQDVNVFCDSAKSYRFGPVGAGKSNKAHVIVRVFDPFTPLEELLVPVDSIPAFGRIVHARRRYQVMWIDEARWFVGKEHASNKHVKVLRAELQTDRKLNQVRVFCDGSIWATTEPLVYSGRITWRLKSLDRTTAELYVWNGHVDPAADEYGQFVSTFEKFPKVPDAPEGEYNELVLKHEHREDDCKPNQCTHGGPWCVALL